MSEARNTPPDSGGGRRERPRDDDNEARANGRRSQDARARPRNWTEPFLLLALQQWQGHGYELIRRMTLFGFETMDPGSVYRTLRQLEKDGLVGSDWDTSHDGPARRVYRLTDAGRDYLTVWADALRGYQTMLDQFFSLYPRASAEPEPSE
jgi:poly-beta-hydroxybutyrate-responsive repressor